MCSWVRGPLRLFCFVLLLIFYRFVSVIRKKDELFTSFGKNNVIISVTFMYDKCMRMYVNVCMMNVIKNIENGLNVF